MAGVSLWIVTFVLLLLLVMVNIVLAMVFDSYGHVRDQISKNETVVAFAQRVLVQMKLQSSWVSNIDMLRKLVQFSVTDPISLSTVRRKCPEICDTQLNMLFANASRKQSQYVIGRSRNALPEYFASLLILVCDVRRGVRLMKADGSSAVEGKMAGSSEVEGKVAAAAAAEPAAAELPPSEPPEWLQRGVMVNLRRQRQDMAALLGQMDEMSAKMARRGMSAEARLKVAKPETPDYKPYLQVTPAALSISSPKGPLKVINCSKKPRVKDATKRS
mmetsp:Transcript_73063/g.184132  ORF Transcript_73063/g.184132 Transcript_73063/m.184132 type:complete len:274 (-) Transcript_73063:102-923(-)